MPIELLKENGAPVTPPAWRAVARGCVSVRLVRVWGAEDVEVVDEGAVRGEQRNDARQQHARGRSPEKAVLHPNSQRQADSWIDAAMRTKIIPRANFHQLLVSTVVPQETSVCQRPSSPMMLRPGPMPRLTTSSAKNAMEMSNAMK